MKYNCISLSDPTGPHIGVCTLPDNTMPKIGEEHYFGDKLYKLDEFRVREYGNVMYFREVK